MDHDRRELIDSTLRLSKENWDAAMAVELKSRVPRQYSPAEHALNEFVTMYHWELIDRNSHVWHLTVEDDVLHRVVHVYFDDNGIVTHWVAATWRKRDGILESSSTNHTGKTAEGLPELLIEPFKALEA